jgi:Flp pilus assembly protein TadG
MNSKKWLQSRICTRRRAAFRLQRRSGAATVELALCLPVVFILVLGMMETCNVVFVRTRMLSATYEAARLATRPTTSSSKAATSAQVTTYCSSLLTQLGIHGATVTLSPTDLSTLTPLTQVTLTVTAPLNQNAITSYVLTNALTISAQVTLIAE